MARRTVREPDRDGVRRGPRRPAAAGGPARPRGLRHQHVRPARVPGPGDRPPTARRVRLGSAGEQGFRRFYLYATASGRPMYEDVGFANHADWMVLQVPEV